MIICVLYVIFVVFICFIVVGTCQVTFGFVIKQEFFLLFKGHVLIFLYAENIEGILELLSKHLRPLASRDQYRACKKMPSIIITSIIRLSSFLEN